MFDKRLEERFSAKIRSAAKDSLQWKDWLTLWILLT